MKPAGGGALDRVLRVMDFVDTHLDRSLTLEDLASQACLSPFHFHRLFTALVGEGPLEYFRRVRLETAAGVLARHRGRSITEVALEFGYSSPEVFVRAFRRQLGVTPGAYRRSPSQALQTGGLRTFTDQPLPLAPEPLRLGTVTLPRMEGIAVRSWNGYGPHLTELWNDLISRVGALGFAPEALDYWGTALDDPLLSPSDRCRYVAWVVPREGRPVPRPLPEGLFRYRWPGGPAISLEVTGGAEVLTRVYRWLFCVWFLDQPWEPVGPPVDHYVGLPEPRTVIHVPVKRRHLE